ncbi:hypothetical protein [Pseudomonas syringae]|jgi:hypothetical protein|uniref:hypothetical protein n=1 Tax=Pseudomonas syringae TaxID=317 RepID=UPI0013C2F97C|nr:hypothetical protein [Pseudomonas syringae]
MFKAIARFLKPNKPKVGFLDSSVERVLPVVRDQHQSYALSSNPDAEATQSVWVLDSGGGIHFATADVGTSEN